MGHNSSPSTLKVWLEGARADIPGIPDLNPKRYSRDQRTLPEKGEKRGNVTLFSAKSRRRLQRDIAKINLARISFTAALTLPGGSEENYLNHDFAKGCFKLFLGRLASQKRFEGVSGYWKREVQKRGAIHYHLLIYGLGCADLRSEFRAWMVTTWNALVCKGMDQKLTEEHRWWHARDENFQKVENMSGYFSKYITKDVDQDAALGGRWWGSFNKSKLPYAKEYHADLSSKAGVLIHRPARKLRAKKANVAKRISDEKAMKKHGFVISEMEMLRLRSGCLPNGLRDPAGAAKILALYKAYCASCGVRLGKARMRGRIPVQSPIVLCNATAPKTVERLIRYAEESSGECIFLEKFEKPKFSEVLPNPRKATPNWRLPVISERIKVQGDFFGALGRLSKDPNTFLQIDREF